MTLPEGFVREEDGSLYASNLGISCREAGYISMPDGFLVSSEKYTFTGFIKKYQDMLEYVPEHGGRSWPRPQETMRLKKQTEDFYNSQFYKDWVFQMPRDWTVLPGNRVISDRGVVFFPNGIMERTNKK